MKTAKEILQGYANKQKEIHLDYPTVLQAMEEYAGQTKLLNSEIIIELSQILEQVEKGFISGDHAESLIVDLYSKKHEWISVKDKLPEIRVMKISNDVIVFDGKDVFQDCYDYEFNQWCKLKYKSTVTHWMPLPEPPTK